MKPVRAAANIAARTSWAAADVQICVEHDAASLARLSGAAKPACDGLIIPYGHPGRVIASTLRSNPLGDHWLIDIELPGDRIVAWSGTIGPELFEPYPPTWMRAGHSAFARFCEQLQPQLAHHHRTLCFHPHSRHVLNDVQTCFNFVASHKGQPFEIALAPASLLEPSMLSDLEDHLRRMFETLGPVCSIVILNDVAASDPDSLDKTIPLGDGLLPRELIGELLRDNLSPDTPIVLAPAKIQQQLQWLGQ
jgi:hypothetical protein